MEVFEWQVRVWRVVNSVSTVLYLFCVSFLMQFVRGEKLFDLGAVERVQLSI